MAPKKSKKKKGSSDEEQPESDPYSDGDPFFDQQPRAAAPVPPPAPVPVVAPVLIEELWAQCDRCQKWRLLPPGTPPPPDNVPWFCTLNPDRLRNNCDAPEQAWNDQGSIEQPLPQPKKKAAAKPKATAARTGLLAVEERGYQKKKQRGGVGGTAALEGSASGRLTLEPVPKVFATPADETRALAKACNKLLTNLGSWDAPRSGQPLTSLDMQIPPWVWSGLHYFAPGPTRVASHALDIFTASEYEEATTSAPEGSTAAWAAASTHAPLQPKESTLRLAVMGAAAAALPGAEEAVAAAAAKAAATVASPTGPGPGASLAGVKQEASGSAPASSLSALPHNPAAVTSGMQAQQFVQGQGQLQQQQQQQQRPHNQAAAPSQTATAGLLGSLQAQAQLVYQQQQQQQQQAENHATPTAGAGAAPWPPLAPPLTHQNHHQQQQWPQQQPGSQAATAPSAYHAQQAPGYHTALPPNFPPGAGAWPLSSDGQLQHRQLHAQQQQQQGHMQYGQLPSAQAPSLQQPWPAQQPQQTAQPGQQPDLSRLLMLNQAFAAQQQQQQQGKGQPAGATPAYGAGVAMQAMQLSDVPPLRGVGGAPAPAYAARPGQLPNAYTTPLANGMAAAGLNAGGLNPNLMAAMNYLTQQQQQQQQQQQRK